MKLVNVNQILNGSLPARSVGVEKPTAKIHQHHEGAYTVIVKGRRYGVNVARSGDAWAGFVNGDFVPQNRAPRTEKDALDGVVAFLINK